MSDSLHDRGQAMENRFFKQNDQELLAKLRDEMAAEDQRKALAHASGLTDEAALDALISNNVSPENVTALSLVPLIAVAWADHKMDDPGEVDAILKAAGEAGVESGSASYSLLQSWLKEEPGDELLEAWKSYVSALKSTLESAAFSQLGNSIMHRAETVANAAGGFLGLGKTSEVERQVLDDLNKVFS
jgi:DNA-binding phage protein